MNGIARAVAVILMVAAMVIVASHAVESVIGVMVKVQSSMSKY